MFNFIEKGKEFNVFDTDLITKIGEAEQDPPIHCHLFVKDTQLFTDTNTEASYVFGELYTSIDVPTIVQNVQVKKINPNTKEPIIVYEGAPSRPIVGQSRKKYSIKFFDSVTPEYPKTITVEYWDKVNKVWVAGQGLTIELIDEATANPKNGFQEDVDPNYFNKVLTIIGTNISLGSSKYREPYVFREIGKEVYYSFKEEPTGFEDYKWDYVLTDNPDVTLPTNFNVEYWHNESWYDAKVNVEIDESTSELYFKSGITVKADNYGMNSYYIDNGDIKISYKDDFYLREQGGTQRIFKCNCDYSVGNNYPVPYTIVESVESVQNYSFFGGFKL